MTELDDVARADVVETFEHGTLASLFDEWAKDGGTGRVIEVVRPEG